MVDIVPPRCRGGTLQALEGGGCTFVRIDAGEMQRSRDPDAVIVEKIECRSVLQLHATTRVHSSDWIPGVILPHNNLTTTVTPGTSAQPTAKQTRASRAILSAAMVNLRIRRVSAEACQQLLTTRSFFDFDASIHVRQHVLPTGTPVCFTNNSSVGI